MLAQDLLQATLSMIVQEDVQVKASAQMGKHAFVHHPLKETIVNSTGVQITVDYNVVDVVLVTRM